MAVKTKTIPHPNDIDLSTHLSNVFGKSEIEQAALTFVMFCQQYAGKRDNFGWPLFFTFEELRAFYINRNLDPNTMLFGLMGNWFDDGGAGYERESPVSALVHYGKDFSVNYEFIERIRSHAKEKTK